MRPRPLRSFVMFVSFGLLGLLAGCPATRPVTPTPRGAEVPPPPNASRICANFQRATTFRPFPARAVSANLNAGSVTIDFLVGPEGVPTELQVISSSHPAFTEPAIEAARSLRCGGAPFGTRSRVTISFSNGGDGA